MSEIEKPAPPLQATPKPDTGVHQQIQNKAVFFRDVARISDSDTATIVTPSIPIPPGIRSEPPQQFTSAHAEKKEIADQPTAQINLSETPFPSSLMIRSRNGLPAMPVREQSTIFPEAIKKQFFTSPQQAIKILSKDTAVLVDEKDTLPIHVVQARALASPSYTLPAERTIQPDIPSSEGVHAPRQKPRTSRLGTQRFLRKVMTKQQEVIYTILVSLWFCTLILFGIWWLQPQHTVTLAGTIINTILLFWPGAMTAYYFIFVARIYVPDSTLPLSEGQVAMIVTKAPMEPWSMVKKTLVAMKAQEFPRDFDTWLADEDPSVETIQWCRDNQVLVISRKGIPGYHNASWPRRKKSKEGNLSFFYEVCGYDWYDFVVQLDADHVPEPNYLLRIVEPFRDPAVGYVAAPSICDANADHSWAARARLYAEASLHGPLQAGYSHHFAPLCIGSHYAIRTYALQEIGGLGPELAEDHSTTLLFNSHGWRGAFALDAIAHGDGPECLTDCLTQEFQWSRSLMKILLVLTPRSWPGLPMKLKAQFLFAQLWYPLSTLYMLLATLCPIIALVTKTPLVNVNYLDFLWHFLTLTFSSLLVVVWIQSHKWLRPANAKILSWEVSIFQFVRWPWILLGVIQATISVLTGKELAFRVTPKGSEKMHPLPVRILSPYTFLVAFICACALIFPGGGARTYQYFVAITILTYTIVLWICIVAHTFENRSYGGGEIWRTIHKPVLLAMIASGCLVLDLFFRWSAIISPFVSTPFIMHMPAAAGFLFHRPFSR
jgi:cellulose synthase (UDP-forming)